ncbi:MAG: hypothetical protein FJZ67_10835 [Bacteroidetes bacterium]|nr:hypothetical protein [Bacteroidota bacterium]
MKNLLIVVCLLMVGLLNAQSKGTITDSRDGKVYKSVVIGTQTGKLGFKKAFDDNILKYCE